jgi:CDP-paratose 2-epimerase
MIALGGKRQRRDAGGECVSVAVVTGSSGLVGSEAAIYFGQLGLEVIGIDNDMRSVFFGDDGSTAWNRKRVQRTLGARYLHRDLDVRDRGGIVDLFSRYGGAIELVVHAAAQPSHDWAAREPFTDFDINAVGTLNLLEATRLHSDEATFIFTSTNKVYGDRPNDLPLVELDTRWELDRDHTYWDGIREDMPIDDCLHSLFGASKVAADVLVQEYGRYFGIKTACFRGGTLTGPHHSAAELHGFLAYLMRCAMTGRTYTVYGYKGKQVRDAIHSEDLIRAFAEFFRAPRVAEVYNIGGGRLSNASVIEAIRICEEIAGEPLEWSYAEANRVGDHIWWIGDNGHFQGHYPGWRLTYDVRRILEEIFEANRERWRRPPRGGKRSIKG